MKSRTIALVAGLVVVLALMTGCPRRGSTLSDADLDAASRSGGLTEQGLGGLGSGSSSLERAKRGLAPEEDGILRDVHFAYDDHALDGEASSILDDNVAWLRENGQAKVELEGHCDDRGTIEYNLALGARRAKMVKDYLVTNGIAANRVATISYGEELPVCHDESDSCWARNRRVHFVILGQ
jgi:peptidoglycan-associated lipoprotein